MEQPKSWSHTLLVLIAKVKGASHWREFQHISLCNVRSKIVYKILAIRINRLLLNLISPWQIGFVPGHGIVDNVLLAQELVLDLDRRLVDPNLILKLEWRRHTIGSTGRSYFFMLRQYGFEEAIMDLLFRTFYNSWFSVLINGELTGFVKSYQGVRQRDPLSPALFLFVAEFLRRGLQRIFDSKDSRYFVSTGPKVPYIAFVDDMIIFTWVSDTQLTLVSTALGYQRQGFPFRYLGVPLIRGRVTYAAFDGLLGKVLQPPKAVLLHLGQVCNAFLWDTSTKAKRVHWAVWDKVCRLVEEGGLGFRLFEDVAKVFSCKLWWKLRGQASIWAMFMHVKYIRGGHPLLVSTDHPSPVWCHLLEVRDLAEGNIRWCLAEGLVNFWLDRWCSDVPLASLVPRPKSHRLVGKFFLSDGWDEPWL
nr:uncharacterized protein LOC113693535 [Coffea arabica]